MIVRDWFAAFYAFSCTFFVQDTLRNANQPTELEEFQGDILNSLLTSSWGKKRKFSAKATNSAGDRPEHLWHQFGLETEMQNVKSTPPTRPASKGSSHHSICRSFGQWHCTLEPKLRFLCQSDWIPRLLLHHRRQIHFFTTQSTYAEYCATLSILKTTNIKSTFSLDLWKIWPSDGASNQLYRRQIFGCCQCPRHPRTSHPIWACFCKTPRGWYLSFNLLEIDSRIFNRLIHRQPKSQRLATKSLLGKARFIQSQNQAHTTKRHRSHSGLNLSSCLLLSAVAHLRHCAPQNPRLIYRIPQTKQLSRLLERLLWVGALYPDQLVWSKLYLLISFLRCKAFSFHILVSKRVFNSNNFETGRMLPRNVPFE